MKPPCPVAPWAASPSMGASALATGSLQLRATAEGVEAGPVEAIGLGEPAAWIGPGLGPVGPVAALQALRTSAATRAQLLTAGV